MDFAFQKDMTDFNKNMHEEEINIYFMLRW